MAKSLTQLHTRMVELVRINPLNNIHVADFPYRLSSWAFDRKDNWRIWEKDDGSLLAWAVMQTPFWTIDYAIKPEASPDIHRQILDWANHQALVIKNSRFGRPAWFIEVYDDQEEYISNLIQTGYTTQTVSDEDYWGKVLLVRLAAEPTSHSTLPDGFTIRSLKGEDEVDEYVSLHREVFGTDNMTREWRIRTLKQTVYEQGIDLVVTSPDGKLVAFCIGWLSRNTSGEISGQIEPLGVKKDYRGLGLGQMILQETIQRMINHQVEQIFVETDDYRDNALKLYQSAGFRVYRKIMMFRKNFY